MAKQQPLSFSFSAINDRKFLLGASLTLKSSIFLPAPLLAHKGVTKNTIVITGREAVTRAENLLSSRLGGLSTKRAVPVQKDWADSKESLRKRITALKINGVPPIYIHHPLNNSLWHLGIYCIIISDEKNRNRKVKLFAQSSLHSLYSQEILCEPKFDSQVKSLYLWVSFSQPS